MHSEVLMGLAKTLMSLIRLRAIQGRFMALLLHINPSQAINSWFFLILNCFSWQWLYVMITMINGDIVLVRIDTLIMVTMYIMNALIVRWWGYTTLQEKFIISPPPLPLKYWSLNTLNQPLICLRYLKGGRRSIMTGHIRPNATFYIIS